MKCNKCKFWELFDGAETPATGFCHRYPPVLAGQAFAGVDRVCSEPSMEDGMHVVTEESDWCGEYKEKPNE